MKRRFQSFNFSAKTLDMIHTIDGVIADYSAQGYRLSLRQLYYRLVASAVVPENTERMYKRIGAIVSDGRLAGLLDWDMIEDRGRSTDFPYTFTQTDPVRQLRNMAAAYTDPKWDNQPRHVEVMVEKDALSGVLGPVCSELQIPFTANKGYSSSSAMYEHGRRLARVKAGSLHVIYLGDHDPSGIDMTRDVEERLTMFAGRRVRVHRVALNMDQVDELNPPENPAKLTDSRATAYIEQFGDASWELDAIEPAALAELVRSAVLDLRDDDLWAQAEEAEEAQRAKLESYADRMRDWLAAEDDDESDDDE